MNGIIVACGGALIAAFVSILTLLLQRKWQKEDRTADNITKLSGKIDDIASELKAHVDANEMNEAKQDDIVKKVMDDIYPENDDYDEGLSDIVDNAVDMYNFVYTYFIEE